MIGCTSRYRARPSRGDCRSRHRERSRRRLLRPAMLLVELLALVAIIIFVLAALTRLVVGQLDLHTVERQHRNRVAAMDGLLSRLRGDLLATSEWTWKDGTLALSVGGRDGVQRVEFIIEADRVARLATATADTGTALVETDAWAAHRLKFEAGVEHGARGALMTLTFIESPPPRRRRLPDRSYAVTLFLPQRPVGDRSPEGAPLPERPVGDRSPEGEPLPERPVGDRSPETEALGDSPGSVEPDRDGGRP